MSSFSSVVQKPGKKIVPKAAPRRNVTRKVVRDVPIVINDSNSSTQEEEIQNQDQIILQPTEQNGAHSIDPGPSLEREKVTDNASSEDQNDVAEPPKEPTVSIHNETSDLLRESDPHGDAITPLKSALLQTQHEDVAADTTERAHTEEVTEISNLAAVPHSHERSNPAPFAAVNSQGSPTGNSVAEDITPSTRRSTRRKRGTDRLPVVSRPTKRRKRGLQVTSTLDLSQNTVNNTTTDLPTPTNLTLSSEDGDSQLPEDLLQSATRRAASVSELANSIETQTRLLRPRALQEFSYADSSGAEAASSELSASQPLPPRRARRKKTANEQAAEVIADIVNKRTTSGRLRGVTPENAGEHELEPAKVTMGDLCEDSKLGKKSALESEMQANWPEILQRRKEDRELALANAEKRRKKGTDQMHPVSSNLESQPALAPAMTVINGVIVIDQASREIDRSTQLQQTAVQDLDNVREDRDYYKHVNQGTVGMKPGHGIHSRWDEDATERFFKGLRMFGTDFLTIAKMFPGLTRKQIKAKFTREENANRSKIRECLSNRVPVDLEDYAQMTNKPAETFQTLESIQKELDEQEKQLREEDNQRRKKEGFITTENGNSEEQSNILPGIENDADGQRQSAGPGRFDAAAREIMEAAMAPKKRQRKASTATIKKGSRGGRQFEGGVEEVLGSIDEVAV